MFFPSPIKNICVTQVDGYYVMVLLMTGDMLMFIVASLCKPLLFHLAGMSAIIVLFVSVTILFI